MLFIEKHRNKLYKMGAFVGGILFAWQIIKAISSLVGKDSIKFTLSYTLILSFLGFILLNLVLALNWKILLGDLGYNLSVLDVVGGYFVSFIPRYIPGSVWGYLSRSEWLFQDYRVPHSVTHFSSILEVGIYLVTPFFLLGEYLLVGQIIGVLSIVVAIVSIRLLKFVLNGTRPTLAWLQSIKIMFLSLKRSAWFITIALFYWILSGNVITLLGSSLFPQAVDFNKWQLITLVYAVAWVIGFLAPFIPAGMGVREVMLVELLSRFAGLTQYQALILAIVARIFTLLAEAVWVIFGVVAKSTTK
ncbi:MAG: lysylphosphatidylglycerol synthase domain-containing protein [Anaerolineales bacterium]